MSTDLFKRTGSQDFSKFLKVMVSGPPKSGKTTLLGTVPNILVLDTEPHANNLDSIAHKDVAYATITNSEDLRHVAMVLSNDSLRQQLAQGTYGIPDIGAVAIDTLDTLQKILKAERLKEQKSTLFTMQDWGWLKTEMENIIQLFTALPMHVFFVVHTKTKEMGKGDDAYTVVLPGLEGAIADSIAGMVGYSLLSFRKEEIAPDGTQYTKYWLRTEGDSTYDFLGTRTAGRLPTIIEPDMATIYNTVMANRPKPSPQAAAAPVATPAQPAETSEEKNPAQTLGQQDEVQTPVQTPEPAPEPTPPPEQAAPPAEKPEDGAPINPAAKGHVKRVYDALEIQFPEDVVDQMTIGDARQLVKFWRAIQEDHSKGNGQAGTTPQSEMIEVLNSYGWLPEEGATQAEKAPTVTPKVDGTIEEVKAYVGDDLARANEAFEVERTGRNRKTLMDWLESKGARHGGAASQDVQTPVETEAAPPWEAVTPTEQPADTSATEDEAVKAVEEGLGGVVVGEEIRADAPCQVCGNPIDDIDLAELGKKRFDKVLCVADYLAELKK